MKAIGKTSTSMENLVQQGGSEMFRDSDKLLSHLQMQSACLNSLDKALEFVTDRNSSSPVSRRLVVKS